MKYLFLFAPFLLLFSCEKKPTTLIKGTVVEYGTSAPIPDAQVSLIAGNSNGIFQPNDEWFLDTIRTNAHGRFEFQTEEDADYFFIASAVKPNFYDLHDPVFFYRGDHEDFEIVLDPYAWLEIEAINVDSIEGDLLTYNCTGISSVSVLTPHYNEIHNNRGNRYLHIYLYIKTFTNPTPEKIMDSIYISSQDTGFYQILY